MENPREESHNKNRMKVCVVCYRKGKRSLSSKDIEAVREYVINGYDVNNRYFPGALCNGCYLLLNKKRNGLSVTLPVVERSGIMMTSTLRSSSSQTCPCKICIVATCKAQSAINLKKRSGRPKTIETTETSLKVCSNCFTKI